MFDVLTDIYLQNQWSHWKNSDQKFPPNFAIYQLHPHQPHSDYPQVVVCFAMCGMSLAISYFVEKKDWLNFANFDETKVDKVDFLWEQNCLECFFELNEQTDYFEINASPNGAYNFYHFDDYRTPNVMPPRRDNHLQLTQSYPKSSLENWHERHFDIRLNHYFADFANQNKPVCQITKINPTAILYQDNQPIFYAINHANPPDFHHKNFWIAF